MRKNAVCYPTNTSNDIKNENVSGPKHATGHNKMQPDVAFSICI